ncbi:DUF2784 domain-containing protein [Mycobacterium sp. M1]|uniref:DUF2784 domain-containing protein n=1 Tax=Mycolicibacter acidiphilus TaxID=2835306 RepID=A0ABS5RL62_9MYCO|nr:DUF2784 domain-containing protein [Mycolicibacter acidiphilus]MBS9535010.1 DUF2784 domain-containing protein [Mycolicibacter acidiphilus]
MAAIVVLLIVALHLAFIGYVAIGGFVALRWRRTIWLHAAAVLWGVLIVTAHLDCPLTWAERRARTAAGMAPLPDAGFIAHYLTGVLYPAGWTGAVEVAVLVLVAVSWWRYARQGRQRRRYGDRHADIGHR